MIRAVWIFVGLVSLTLGFIGAVLPLLPTTPFVLVAVFAFSRSSPRLHAWLIHHPRFGPAIGHWQKEGAISRRAKRLAVAVMALSLVISYLLGVSQNILILQAFILTAAACFVLSRPDPKQSL